jgi:hypothetical protein
MVHPLGSTSPESDLTSEVTLVDAVNFRDFMAPSSILRAALKRSIDAMRHEFIYSCELATPVCPKE